MIAVYRSLDTHFLVVNAAAQPSAVTLTRGSWATSPQIRKAGRSRPAWTSCRLRPRPQALAAPLPGPNLPTPLPNRLADVYKAIGELNGHQQRVWESTGYFCERLTFKVPVEGELPEAIFTINWDTERNPITMILTDPKGNILKHAPPDVREIQDPTHHPFRVQKPLGGDWIVDLRTSCANYLFILSARSQTSMHLGFGLPPAERTVGAKIPILAVLADEKPIAGAEVWTLVQGPNAEMKQDASVL